MIQQPSLFSKHNLDLNKDFLKSISNKPKKVKPSKKEEKIQITLSEYIKLKYPDVIFNCDYASGFKMPIWIAAIVKRMRSSSGLPDITIYEPRGNYYGLIIELKKDGSSPFKKNGEMKSNKHTQKQGDILDRLKSKGYKACFAVGLDQAIKTVDEYMDLRKNY